MSSFDKQLMCLPADFYNGFALNGSISSIIVGWNRLPLYNGNLTDLRNSETPKRLVMFPMKRHTFYLLLVSTLKQN